MAEETSTTAIPNTVADKDTLLIISSIAMAIATIALVVVVRLLERCLPDIDDTHPRNREPSPDEIKAKAEKMQTLLEKNAESVLYKDWVVREKNRLEELDNQHTSRDEKRLKKSPTPAPVGALIRVLSRVYSSTSVEAASSDPHQQENVKAVRSRQEPSLESVEECGEGRLANEETESNSWVCDCAVCLTEFEPDETVWVLPCSHIFHQECIHGWFCKSRRPACPLCRFNLKSRKIDVDTPQTETPQEEDGETDTPDTAAASPIFGRSQESPRRGRGSEETLNGASSNQPIFMVPAV